MATKKNPPKKKPQDTDEDQDPTKETDTDEGDEDDDDDDAAEENRRINAIVTSRVKREMKAVNQTLQAIQESIKTLAAPKKPDQEDEDEDEDADPKDKKETQVDPKVTKKLTRLERELADEKAARKKAEEERSQEAERGKKAEMRQLFQTHLTEYGLTSPRLMRAALDQLEQDGVMIRDEDGKIKFKGQDKYGIETLFDPKVGLKAWVNGDGKEFVPAVDAGGSGTGGSVRGTGNGTQALTQKDLKKMSPQQLAAINLERACSGLPELEVGE